MSEYLRENEVVSYPFHDLDAVPDLSLFVDASVWHTIPPNEHGRVKLITIDPVNSPQLLTLTFEDSTPICTLVDGVDGVAFATYTLGEYRVYEWKRVSARTEWFTGDEVCARFTLKGSVVDLASWPLSPSDAYLLSSVVITPPGGVRKIAVKQPGLPCCVGGGFVQGHVRFQSGNNISLSDVASVQPITLGLETIPDVRPASNIYFDAIPGKGTGKALGCPNPDESIKTISAKDPDENGNYNLVGSDCVWLERPLVSATAAIHQNTDYHGSILPSALKLNGDCKACCDCDDYGAAYAALAEVWERAKLVAAKIEALRVEYSAQRTEWLNSVYCAGNKVLVGIRVFAAYDYHLAIAVTVLNRSPNDLDPVRLTFEVTPDTGTFEAGSGQLETTNRTYQIDLTGDSVEMGVLTRSSQGRYSYEMRWNGGTDRASLLVRVGVTVTTSIGTFTAQDVTQLRRPLQKD